MQTVRVDEQARRPRQLRFQNLDRHLTLMPQLFGQVHRRQARVYELDPLRCPGCHGPLRILTFRTDLIEMEEEAVLK